MQLCQLFLEQTHHDYFMIISYKNEIYFYLRTFFGGSIWKAQLLGVIAPPPPRSAYDSEYSKGKLCDLIKSLEITKFLTNTRYVNKFS